MEYRFEEDPSLIKDAIEVLVRSQRLNTSVQEFLDYLEDYDKKKQYIFVKSADSMVIINPSDLIYVDIDDNKLILSTLEGDYRISERLYKLRERLNQRDFIQVSKQSLLNINHLEALKASFSGNMTALLTGGRTVHVSRRYLKDLEKVLGL